MLPSLLCLDVSLWINYEPQRKNVTSAVETGPYRGVAVRLRLWPTELYRGLEGIDADPAEKCRTNLIILLSTSCLVPHATKLFLCGPQEGSASLVDQLAMSTSDSATPQEERRRALRRLLSCRREASPIVRLCHEISAPIPNMSDAHKDIWLRALSVGRVFLHPVTGSSLAFDFNIHALDLLGLSSRSPLIPATPRMTPQSKSLRKTSTDSPRLLVSASSELPVEPQFTTQEPSSAPPPAPSSFAPPTEPSVLSPRAGTQSSEVTPSSNPSILLQTLVNLLANSDDNSGSPNPNMLSFLTLGNGTSQEAIRLLFPSNSTQSVMDLLAHRNLSAPTPGTPQPPSAPTKSSGAIMSVLRVFHPTKNVYSHFLLVTGPEITPNAPRPEAASATTALSDVAQGGRMLNIYKLDHILCQLARYQDNGMHELAKLRLVTALLRTRHGRLDRSSLSLAPCEGSLYQPENLKDLRRIRPGSTDGTAAVGQSAWELLSAISSGSSELTAPFQPFSIPFSELQRASVASVNFDVLSVAVNPISQAQFAVCGPWECFILGISSTGQITGRISVSPKREDRGEQLIKAVWLPDSLSLLALLTSGSVQIFDIFHNPKEPKYHFKPVEGSFCDATFIRLPYKGPACTSAPSTTPTGSEPIPQEWGVHLVVMAKKMGSLLYQQLGPDCMSSTDPFYLAEWLDWSPEVLTLRAVDSDDDEDPAPPGLQRNPNTGVLGGGGVSLHYVASLGLLLHAYQSGHSVASAIHLPGVSDDNPLSTVSTTQLKITYSFLLATGPRDNQPTHSHSSSSPFGLLSAESSVTSLLFAARGAINPSDLSNQPFSIETNSRITGPPILPAIGPITRWSEVMGGHPGLISAVSLSNIGNANAKGSVASVTNTLPHKPVLLAVEPDQIWVQPLQLLTSKTMVATLGSSRSGRSKRQSDSTTPTTTTADSAQRVGEELVSSVVPVQTSLLDSCSVYWPGKQNLAGRTITFLLTTDGRLLAHSTRPRSVVYSTESAVYPETPSPLTTYPGQFWWQRSMCSPDLLSGLHTRLECLCSIDRTALSTGGILNFGLEQGGIWDLATADLPKALLTFPAPKKPNKALRRRLVEAPSVGPLPADFFEHVTSTEEVDFAGAELLQTYNRDQLRRRLLTPGSPVTGAWTSVNSTGSNASAGSSSHKVAYIIEIHNRTPSETAIVGVRIGLPAATEEYATRWPKFIKVFNRIVPITPPSSGAMARMVDVALYRSEMLQSCKMLQVLVGCSADPEGLTSVDLVSVYTAPKSDLDTTRIPYEGLLRRPSSIRLPSYGTAHVGPLDLFVHRTPRLVGQANIHVDASSAARAPLADMKSICSTSTPSEHVLAYRLDRLFATGFVTIATSNDRSCNRTTSSVCVHPPPPLPPSPALLSSLIRLGDPPMVVIPKAKPVQGHQGISCFVDRPLCGHPLQEVIFLTASLCDLLTASLHWGTGAENLETSTSSTGVRLLLSCLEQVLSTPPSLMTMPTGAQATPHALDTIRSQASKLLTSLLSNEQTMDPKCSLFGPFLWNLSRQLFRLIAVITQLVEQRKTCETGLHANTSAFGFQQPITNVVNSAVLQLTDICQPSSSRSLATDKLLQEFQHLTTFVHHLALVDPMRLRNLQDHHQLTKLVLTAFETVERYLPIPTCLRDPLHPIWINHCGLVDRLTTASHGSTASSDAATVRAFVLSAVHCLYALLISTLSPDITTPTHDIRMDERGERIYAVLLNLLMHPNLSVSCAARDGLCRLLLTARPKYPITWSVIDHRPEDDGYLPCRPPKFGLDDTGQTARKTAATNSIDKSASRPTRESAPPPTSHFGRSSVTPYPARRRPQRNLAHAGNRMRPAWLSWENETNAPTRIPPFERSLVRNLGTSSSSASSSILPAILDLENSTGWGAGTTDQQDAERFLNVIRLGRQLISSPESDFDDEDADGADDADSDANLDLGDNAVLNDEMAVLLAQLLAEADQSSLEGSSLLGQLPWSLSSRLYDRTPQQQQQEELERPQQQTLSHDVTGRAATPRPASDSSADEGQPIVALAESAVHHPETEQTEIDAPSQSQVQVDLEQDWPAGTSGDEAPTSVGPTVDLEGIESAIQFLGSGSQEDPLALRDLLEQVDEDALLNYALRLSLRDQGGPGGGQPVTGLSTDEAQALETSLRRAPEVPAVEDVEDSTATLQPAATDVGDPGVTTITTTKAPQVQPVAQVQAADSAAAPLTSVVHVPTDADVPADKDTTEKSERPSIPQPSEAAASDSDGAPCSHILSRSGSVDSFVFITDDTSTSHGQSSEDSSSDGPPYNGSLIKVVRCRSGAASRSQRPALFFALCLAHQLAQKWPEFARQAALEQHTTPALAVRRFAPVLQLFVSLVRVIHANLVYLHVMLYAPLAKLDPTSTKFVKVKALLATVRKSLKNLIHVLLTSLTIPSVALLQKTTNDSPSVPSETSLPIALMFSTPSSVAVELSVMQLNALSEMFSRIPHLTRWTGTAVDPSLSATALSLLHLLYLQPQEDVIETTSTEPAIASSGTVPVRGDPAQANAVNQALELCLTMLEVLYSRIREGVCKTDPKEKASLNFPTVAGNPSVAGLLQAALLGTASHNTGLLAETGASCLASWSPLLESQFSLDHLANPLHEIGWIAIQACLRLPRIILLLRGSSAAARGRVRSAPTSSSSTTVPSTSHRKASQVAVEFESRWCSVLYDYLELVNSPELLNLQSDHSDPDHHSVRLAGRSLLPAFFSPSYPRSKELTDRIERQIRGLLIRIVGPKHYRQLHDIHRLAHLIQRVRDICVNTGEFLPSPSPRVSCPKRTNQLPTVASIEPFIRRLRLSYICEREILQTISACLTIALHRTSYWQRFCLRCPDTLIFLFHASLVLDREIARNMLPLIQLAIAPETVMVIDSSGVETSIQATAEDQRRETTNVTTEVRLAQSMANHLFANQEDPEKTTSGNTADLVTAPPLLLQFIRVFLCGCPQYTLRKSAAHIIRAIYRSISPSSQTRVLHLLSLLWSDLPTFAPYSSQFVQLITGMLIEHPEWSGRADLLERTFRTMLRRLDALKRHPRRILYSTLMHLVQPHRDSWFTQSPSVSGPTSTDTLSTTTSRRIPDPPGTVQRSTGTEPTLSRSWSVIASIKPTGTSHAATSTAAPTSTATATTSTTVIHQPVISRSSSSTEATVDSNAVCLANLGFDFELEPCLMCHAKAIDEPFYVILRWDSEASGSRLPIQVAIMTMHSHYSKFVDRLKQAMGQQQQQLAQRHLISSGSSATTSTTPAAGSATVATGAAVGPAQLTTNVNHSGSSGTAANCSSPCSTTSHHPTMPMIPVKLDVRATSSIHVFDLDAVYLISQLTVKFNVLYKRPRYVRTLNVYTSELIDRTTSRLIHEPWLWQKVATVHLSPNQTTVRLCFSHPAPTPTWLGTTTKDHATDDRFVSDQLSHRTGQSKEISYHGLPIRASRLIFEYADFHTNGTEAKRVCPRCHATNLLGSTCPACHTNVNECFRCRSINLSVGDVYLCANCGSSRHGKIEFSICARPCYSAVEPLHDREDRDSACNRIVSLSKELVKNAQTLARPIEIEVAQCLSDLVTMDAATAAAVTSVSLSRSNEPSSSSGGGGGASGGKSKFSSQSGAIKSTPTGDAKFILAAASSASSSLGSVHSGITRLAACVAEARAISLDAAAITRRLWATRQSVVEFDAAQQRCASAAEKRLTSNAVNHGTGGTDEDGAKWPNYEELDAVFSPSISGCYSCLIHTVHQCGRLLLGVAEHTKIELSQLDPSNCTSREHWIFTGNCYSTTSNQRLQLVQDLISCLIESGLSVCPQAIQADLRELIVQLTRDCPVLIDHFGKVLFERLFQTALAQGDQAYLLGPLVYTDIALLQTSVESILPPSQSSSLSSSSLAASVSDIPGRSQPMDQRAPYWEARLRPMFRLLVELTRPGLFEPGSDHGARPGSSIPLPVVQNILIPLMELMETIVSHSSPFAASAFVSSPAEADVVATDTAEEPRAPRTAGGSGESQPAAQTRVVTSDIMQLPPQTNFSEWLDSRPHASYSAWCGALRDQSRSSGSDLVRPGLAAGSDSSNILASIPKTPRLDSTLEHSWITSILFCPSDPTSRCVHACMDLLNALSSDCPRSSSSHPATGSSVADAHSSQALALLYSRRRRVILRYLTQTCLPRLDELVAARGAAVSPSALLNSSDASVFTMVLNPGDAFVAKWRKLTMVEEGAQRKEGTDGDEDEGVSEASRSTLISFLLDEVSFLDHLGTLVERLLLRLRILESMPIRHWDELVAATLSSASGTGAMHGSTPGYTIALVAELLRVLEPLKKLPGHHQYRLLQILLHACVRLRQLVLQRTECTLRAQGIFGTMLDQLIGVSSSQIREFLT
ncbi:E3 ubiquitin-protein ligase UBR4, partial [Clonorchis sinensis]